MSSGYDPTFLISKYTPAPGDHHNVVHPIVELPSGLSQPFTLLTNPPPPDDMYSTGFDYYFWQGGGSAQVRIYMAAFASSVSSPTWWHSLSITSTSVQRVRFPKSGLNGGTNLWIGAWWDDGTFAGDQQGVIAYFTAHGVDGGHHSVPIITR